MVSLELMIISLMKAFGHKLSDLVHLVFDPFIGTLSNARVFILVGGKAVSLLQIKIFDFWRSV